MLCLLIKKRLKRRTLKEKLHLTKNNTVVFIKHNTPYGEIVVYTLYSYKGMEKAVKKLRKAVPYPLYTCHSAGDDEYIKKAIICSAISYLKRDKGKTVYFALEKPSLTELVSLCSVSNRLYVPFGLSKAENEEIYRLCGTLPIYQTVRTVCDIYIDKNYPFTVNLPQNLQEVCPKEFSKNLFASLLYRENGRFLL